MRENGSQAWFILAIRVITYLANHWLRRNYGACPQGAVSAKVWNAVVGLKRGPVLASKPVLVQLTAHFTASSSPGLWIHRSGSPEFKEIFAWIFTAPNCGQFQLLAPWSVFTTKLGFAFSRHFVHFRSRPRVPGIWQMMEQSGMIHDVLSSSRWDRPQLGNMCRKTQNFHPPAFARSCKKDALRGVIPCRWKALLKKRNVQLVSGGDLGDRDGARCRRFFPSETATAHPVLALRPCILLKWSLNCCVFLWKLQLP